MSLWDVSVGIFAMLLFLVFCWVAFGFAADLWYGMSGAGHRETVNELCALREEFRVDREAPTIRRDEEEKDTFSHDPLLPADRLPQ